MKTTTPKTATKKTAAAVAGLILALLPTAVFAAPMKAMHKAPVKKAASAAMYQCQKCHMKMSAAQAKKDHYKDPVDGGTLVPMAAKGDKPMGGMKM